MKSDEKIDLQTTTEKDSKMITTTLLSSSSSSLPTSVYSSPATTTATSTTESFKKENKRTLSFDESGSNHHPSKNNHNHSHHHHHNRVYSHHSTSPLLSSGFIPERLPPPPRDLLHPMAMDHGNKPNNNNRSNNNIISSSELTQQGQPPYSTHSSPEGDIWQKRRLQTRYRTISFDGKMFRSNSNNMYQRDYNNEDQTIISPLPYSNHRRSGSFNRIEDRELLMAPLTKYQNNNKVIHSHSAQDPIIKSDDERTGLLSSQQKQNYTDDNSIDDDPSKNRINPKWRHEAEYKKKSDGSKDGFIYYIVYALLNTMMSVPSLYGYASVIFNHSAFQPYIATLSKLVIWSSAVHQFCFVCISSISFAKAEVQDAGLLFLSCISQFIAARILEDQGTIEEIISTTVVALGIATASLGMMLMLMGRFNYANAVSYLPLPVIGGYLAYIGYFCVVAGVGLCISKSMIGGTFVSDMQILSDRHSLLLAAPGILSGVVMMMVARYAQNDITLPAVMVAIPSIFYAVLYISGYTMDDAREYHWIGEIEPHSSLSILLDMIDLDLVRWDLVFSSRCITVWIGMVFVVSFSSCLDVAAIAMDMGEPLNVNKELVTVGLSNLFSGALLGQSGSYIFSQTILTYRTGFHSRWIGFLGSLMFLFFSFSTVNLLEVAPLYFLGSTLIFIGIDLLYEWLIEVSHKLLVSEYLVLIATFIAIQIEGIDAGIIVGLIVAVVEYVVTSSQLPSLRRVLKRSRAVWEPQHRQLLQEMVYDSKEPKIVCLEITETVFFGSSLQLFSQICDEIGLDASANDMDEIATKSPRLHSSRTPPSKMQHKKPRLHKKAYPRYVVLEMSQVANVDASAARSCFLSLSKLCSRHGIVLCACGANSRVDWILRSHDVVYTNEEDEVIKNFMLDPFEASDSAIPKGKLILFSSTNECLELCENQLIYEYKQSNLLGPPILGRSVSKSDLRSNLDDVDNKTPLSVIFGRILGMNSNEEKQLLSSFDSGGSADIDEIELIEGQTVFKEDDLSDGFFVVLRGSISIRREEEQRRSIRPPTMLSLSMRSSQIEQTNSIDIASTLSVGGIFGYVDFAIQRRRSFNAVCTRDGTIIAKISQTTMERLKRDDTSLHHIIEKVLLQASLLELANIDVS